MAKLRDNSVDSLTFFIIPAIKVGEDEYGNTYFEEKGKGYDGRKRRWVTYSGYADASRVPPEWHGWMHYMYDETPAEAPLPMQSWELPHQPMDARRLDVSRPENIPRYARGPWQRVSRFG